VVPGTLSMSPWDENMDTRPYIAIAYDVWDHPKILSLGDPDTALTTWFRLMTYCNQYKTDGKIPEKVVKKFKKRLVEKLLKSGLLERTNDPEIFVIHDYLKHQKSRAQLEALSAAKAGAGSKGAHKRWHVDREIRDETCMHCMAEA
jgi:hypothetical protein